MQQKMQDVCERLKSIKKMSELKYDEIDKCGEQLGLEMYNKRLTVTQLRKIYNIILFHKQKFDKDRLRLIKPLLAYIAAKEKTIKDLYDQLRDLVDKVDDEKDFEKFYRLMESILAYYEYYKATSDEKFIRREVTRNINETRG